MTFFRENLSTIIISIIVFSSIIGIVIKMIIDKKKGKGTCNCGCSCDGCASNGICHNANSDKL